MTSGAGLNPLAAAGVRSSLMRFLEVFKGCFFDLFCSLALALLWNGPRSRLYITPWISLEPSAPHVILYARCVLIGPLRTWRPLRGGLAAGINASVRVLGLVPREMKKYIKHNLWNTCGICKLKLQKRTNNWRTVKPRRVPATVTICNH